MLIPVCIRPERVFDGCQSVYERRHVHQHIRLLLLHVRGRLDRHPLQRGYGRRYIKNIEILIHVYLIR